eukprot:gene7265-1298_t
MPGGTGFMTVSAGGFHAVALKDDGTLLSWGDDSRGRVSDSPHGTGFILGVAGGGTHSVALRKDGTLCSWGWDGHCQHKHQHGATCCDHCDHPRPAATWCDLLRHGDIATCATTRDLCDLWEDLWSQQADLRPATHTADLRPVRPATPATCQCCDLTTATRCLLWVDRTLSEEEDRNVEAEFRPNLMNTVVFFSQLHLTQATVM